MSTPNVESTLVGNCPACGTEYWTRDPGHCVQCGASLNVPAPKARVVNLTPHAITVRVGMTDTVFPPSGQVARVTQHNQEGEPLGGIPTSYTVYGIVEGMPSEVDKTIYIVSMLVAQRLAGQRHVDLDDDVHGRFDFVSPDTGPSAIRENGQIIAVRGFVRY